MAKTNGGQGMRRLNVQLGQLEECIRMSLFAIDKLPRNPPLAKGEVLLLQLVKAHAQESGQLDRRIEFALIFDHVEEDRAGDISRRHWPSAGKTWKHIVVCSETIATLPFSLEALGLSRAYSGQANPMYIDPADEAKIRPFLDKSGLIVQPQAVGVRELLVAIGNYDRVSREAEVRTTRVAEHDRRLRNPWLGNTLKALYEHRCQICTHDFRPRYDVAYADTRLLRPTGAPLDFVSKNVVVLCPNHNAIIGEAKPSFDDSQLAFRYQNGLVEKIMLRDHFIA
jgi:hypothetical protein